jgi:hypothetical protein
MFAFGVRADKGGFRLGMGCLLMTQSGNWGVAGGDENHTAPLRIEKSDDQIVALQQGS